MSTPEDELEQARREYEAQQTVPAPTPVREEPVDRFAVPLDEV